MGVSRGLAGLSRGPPAFSQRLAGLSQIVSARFCALSARFWALLARFWALSARFWAPSAPLGAFQEGSSYLLCRFLAGLGAGKLGLAAFFQRKGVEAKKHKSVFARRRAARGCIVASHALPEPS